MNRKNYLLLAGVGLLASVFGGLAGFWLALKQVNLEVQIDYDSGATRQVIQVGPFKIRELEFRSYRFGEVRMKNGATCLTGKPNWQTAIRFYGNSQRGNHSFRSNLIGSIGALEGWRPICSAGKISDVKEKVLNALARDRIAEVDTVVGEFRRSMVDGLRSNSSSIKQ